MRPGSRESPRSLDAEWLSEWRRKSCALGEPLLENDSFALCIRIAMSSVIPIL